ncbi:MAG: RHS repeat-associated core domain-containing protein [Candidatus Marinimicrobia bacterium]|nr:RHS repeat-associated core domain-containing protein [Candidatus Neomarinimicrobiota bacterium]
MLVFKIGFAPNADLDIYSDEQKISHNMIGARDGEERTVMNSRMEDNRMIRFCNANSQMKYCLPVDVAYGVSAADTVKGDDTQNVTMFRHIFASDQIMSSKALVDESGNQNQTRDYYPYGNTRTATGSISAYQFSGKEKDVTGLYYFGKRYYDPNIGRWLSVDPMADKYPSLSPYVYCANNPLRFVDMAGDTINVSEEMSQNKALYAFIQTKAGIKLISLFAYKDQSISVCGKSYNFSKAGKFSTANLNFIGVINGDAKTVPSNSGVKNLVSKVGDQSYDIYISNNTFENQVDDVFHEVQHASMFQGGNWPGKANDPDIIQRHHAAMALNPSLWGEHEKYLLEINSLFRLNINPEDVKRTSLINPTNSDYIIKKIIGY